MDDESLDLSLKNTFPQDEPLDLTMNGPYRSTARKTERDRQSSPSQRPAIRPRQASPAKLKFKSKTDRKRPNEGDGGGPSAKKNAREQRNDEGDQGSSPTTKRSNKQTRTRDNHAFKVQQDGRIKKWKSGVEEKKFRVQFNKEHAGERLIDVRDQLVEMFDTVIQQAGKNYSRQDKARMSIFHDSLETEMYVHLQNLENLTGEAVMNRFERVLNSHEEMTVNKSFNISVGLLRMKKGGGKSGQRLGSTLSLFPHLDGTRESSVVNKRAIVEVVCAQDEQICAAKAVAILVAKKSEKMRRSAFDSFVRKSRQCTLGNKGLRAKAMALLAKAGLPNNRPLTFAELADMEPVVNAKILIITHGGVGPHIVQCSNTRKYDMQFFLYHTSDHFHAVLNPGAMFPNSVICPTCYGVYKYAERKQHPCIAKGEKCFACGRKECEMACKVECHDCNITFRNFECYDIHLKVVPKRGTGESGGGTLCDRRKKCANCHKVVYSREQKLEDHVCGTYKCFHCQKWVDNKHLCYLRRKKMKLSGGKFLFFDFESVCDSIFECRESYSPKKPEGCGEALPDDGHIGVNPGVCSRGRLCRNCRKCGNCHKTYCGRIEHQPNLVVAESCCDECADEVLVDGSTCANCGDTCSQCSPNKKTKKSDPGPSESEACSNIECGKRRVVFKGLDTVYKFCMWLFSPKHSKFTVMAHFGKGYDFMFLLNWLITEAGILPDCIFSGSKIMSMEVKEGLSIRCVDSLNFMMMPLKKLPKAFGLKPEQAGLKEGDLGELAKLDFPHAFNTRDRWTYVGEYPPLEMYDLESKSESEKERLREWHGQQRGKTFNLQKELEHYCKLDTTILRLACMTFRSMIKDITLREGEDGGETYVDAFAHVTMASCVMQIFRLNHIKEFHDITLGDGRSGRAEFKGGDWFLNGEQVSPGDIVDKEFVSSTISQIPAWGYVRTSNHSAKSIQWLEYIGKGLGRQVIHARNVGEHEIRCGSHRYRVDGFDPEPVPGGPNGTVYEFLGCFYHGHLHCLSRLGKNVRDPRTNFTLEDLNNQTKERLDKIKAEGYLVKSIYECEFDKMVKENEEIREFIDKELDVPARMNTRMAFYGGRTSGFELHSSVNANEGEEIHYVDVCSLYPFINKHKRLPLGHPEIITSHFDMTLNSYFGIVHAKVLPPQDDYIGVLPFRARGKLHFPLCSLCCETGEQGPCTHADEERCLTGVWCSPELQEAVRAGYKVIKVYEVYHYAESSEYDMQKREGGLFAEQVDLFLKLKTQASGFPQWVHTESDKAMFIKQFEEKTGVRLEKGKIEVNPALRSISKLCLNCFWGKLGQRNNLNKSKYINSTAELDRMLGDASVAVTNFHIINEDVLVVEYKNAKDFEEESGFTNNVLAGFTTCYGRLELLKHIRTVGPANILYVDTDSLIFKTRKSVDSDGKVKYENYPPTGDSLGDLTNELPEGVHITEFCCSAPKSYALRLSNGVEICKFKGVTLNTRNSKRVNFQGVKELVLGERKKITLEPEIQFHRSKFDGVITNLPLTKTIKHTFDKRRILENLDTVPYGYVC